MLPDDRYLIALFVLLGIAVLTWEVAGFATVLFPLFNTLLRLLDAIEPLPAIRWIFNFFRNGVGGHRSPRRLRIKLLLFSLFPHLSRCERSTEPRTGYAPVLLAPVPFCPKIGAAVVGNRGPLGTTDFVNPVFQGVISVFFHPPSGSLRARRGQPSSRWIFLFHSFIFRCRSQIFVEGIHTGEPFFCRWLASLNLVRLL